MLENKYWRRYVGKDATPEPYSDAVGRLGQIWESYELVRAKTTGFTMGAAKDRAKLHTLGEHTWRKGGEYDVFLDETNENHLGEVTLSFTQHHCCPRQLRTSALIA